MRNQGKLQGASHAVGTPREMEVFDSLPAVIRAEIRDAPYKLRAESIADALEKGWDAQTMVTKIRLEMQRLFNLNAVA